MKVLAFSDLHCDLAQAQRLVEAAQEADVVVGVGDFASVHSGLEETIAALAAIDRPALLVPGNNETPDALREACGRWETSEVLHGRGTVVQAGSADAASATIFGLGGGVPVTPWDWSFDLTEEEAERMLEGCPEAPAILAAHSPPHGHVDSSGGRHLGSRAVLGAIEARRPALALCGHIHESWGQESSIGPTRVVNLGPQGRLFCV